MLDKEAYSSKYAGLMSVICNINPSNPGCNVCRTSLKGLAVA